MTSITTAVIQQAIKTDCKHTNWLETEHHIHTAVKQGAQLILLQELHAGFYFCQHQDPALFELAEPLDGPTATRCAKIAGELKIVLIASIFERRAAGLYHNTALVFDGEQGLVGIYRKMHIPDDPGFNEKYYFTPGEPVKNNDNPFKPIPTSLGAIGTLVCWDQWYPEAARISALQGADILVYPTAIGWDPQDTDEEQQRQQEAWTLIQRSHAVANHLPVLVANRTGFEAHPVNPQLGTQFWGQSFIAGQQGELLAIASKDFEGPLIATIDTARTEALRRIWPYFRDRRIDSYSGLLRRYID